MVDAEPLKCPVCGAKFRGTRECSRCGADLSPLMYLADTARQMRNKARQAISACDGKRAHDLAEKAQRLHATETGRRLLSLAVWLNESRHFNWKPLAKRLFI